MKSPRSGTCVSSISGRITTSNPRPFDLWTVITCTAAVPGLWAISRPSSQRAASRALDPPPASNCASAAITSPARRLENSESPSHSGSITLSAIVAKPRACASSNKPSQAFCQNSPKRESMIPESGDIAISSRAKASAGSASHLIKWKSATPTALSSKGRRRPSSITSKPSSRSNEAISCTCVFVLTSTPQVSARSPTPISRKSSTSRFDLSSFATTSTRDSPVSVGFAET